MNPEERARRREERRKLREAESFSSSVEHNGPSLEESDEERSRRERRERRTRERGELSNQITENNDSERLRQKEEERPKEQRQRQTEEEDCQRRQAEEESRLAAEEENRKAEEKKRMEEQARQEAIQKAEMLAKREKKRNAEIERQNEEDIQRAENGDDVEPKKKFNLLGRVSKGRKKEILAMLLQKARGDLQVEEKAAEEEKHKFICESVNNNTQLDSLKKDQLRRLIEEFHNQLHLVEGEKFDLEIKIKRRDLQISNLKVKANETRGKFAMPTLKTVRKPEIVPRDSEDKRV